MKLDEASRQYQAVLEARRTLLAAVDGSVSFEDEREAADAELDAASATLFDAWMEDRCG